MNQSPRKVAMQERRAHWRSIVEQGAQSALPVRQFCQQHQIDEQQFYNWRRILAQESGIEAAAPSATSFALVRPAAAPAPDSTGAVLELVLERGWRLRIPQGVDEATLRCVLTALAPRA